MRSTARTLSTLTLLALLAPRVFAAGDAPLRPGEPVYESSVGGVIHAPALAGAAGQGYLVFNKWCSGCHAPDYAMAGDTTKPPELPLPSRVALGTALLRQRYQGRVPAELERRTDLTGPVIGFYVRRGIDAMPPFRKTEITDPELATLVAYLTRARPDRGTQ
jgi:mono/diheme cytochrome c family protein